MIISPPIFSMKVFRISGRAGTGKMQELLPENALLLDAGKINSEEELELAYRLARDAFDKRRNIAKQFRYEFLLWISGKKAFWAPCLPPAPH